MRRFFLLSLLVVIALITASPAAAQQADTDNGIDIDPSVDVNVTTYAQEVDSTLRIVEYEYLDNRGGFHIVFEADRSKRITLTEAVQFEEGAGSGRLYQQRIPSGQTEVFVAVSRQSGQAALTLTTAETLEENRFVWISTGQQGDNPFEGTSATAGWVGGFLTTAGMIVLAVRRVSKKKRGEVSSGWAE